MDEMALIKRAQKGDVTAFNELVLTHQDAVYNYAFYIMADPAAAGDATQEAFIAAYKAINRYQTGHFKAWMMSIVRNKCRDMLRKYKRHPNPSLDEMTEDNESLSILTSAEATPEAQQEQSELMGAVQHCLAGLPEGQRAAFVLRDVEGYNYAEISNILTISLGTVKSRLNRARRKLQDCLRLIGELLPGRYRS